MIPQEITNSTSTPCIKLILYYYCVDNAQILLQNMKVLTITHTHTQKKAKSYLCNIPILKNLKFCLVSRRDGYSHDWSLGAYV